MASTSYPRLNSLLRSALAFLGVVALMGLPLGAQSLEPRSPAGSNPPDLSSASPSDPDGSAQPEHASEGQDLSLEQILAKHFEVGGGARQQAIQAMKMTGVSVVMGMEAPYTRFTKRPNKVLLEIYVQGMTGVQAFDGETAWWFMPFMGHAAAEAMPPDMAQGMVEAADFDGPLVDTEAKGHTLELLGVDQVGGADVYKIEVTMATGGTQFHYIDTETFYTVRVESSGQNATFKDFELIEGFPVPHTVEIIGPMGEQLVYVDTVEFDVEIDDTAFSMR